MGEALGAGVVFFMSILGIIALILWIFVPFILMSHGAKYKRMMELQEETNALLRGSKGTSEKGGP